MGCFIAVLVLAEACIQGGYFPTVYLLAGIVLAALSFTTIKRQVLPAELVLWGISGIYLAASLASGYDASSLAQASLPLVCACFLRIWLALPTKEKDRAVDIITAGTGILAAVGIFIYSGAAVVSGAITANRLQFPFQYANTAGIWYAAAALLCQDGKDRTRKHLLPILTALFLTRSTGALGVYGLIQCLRLVLRRREKGLWRSVLLSNFAAALCAAGIYFAPLWGDLALLALLYVLGYFWDVLEKKAVKYRLYWLCLAGGAAGVAVLLGTWRFSQSLQTFAERLCQMTDGTALILRHPLLGVGAGRWAELYPYCQSAQYTSTVIHSGPVQIGVDAGVFTVLLALAFLVLAWRRTKWLPARLAAGLILLHSVVDFDLQFFPVCALLFMLLFFECELEPAPGKREWIALTAVFTASVVLCAALFYVEQERKQLIFFSQRRDWPSVIAHYERERAVFGDSRDARSCYIGALYRSGELQRVVDETAQVRSLSVQELLLRAQALYTLGDRGRACELLLSELRAQHKNVMLFQETADRLTEWQADQQYIDAYNRIVEDANKNTTLLGNLLDRQTHIDQISDGS